jgi:3-oxoacyl-[acyl-carrier-protein] synthase II
MSSIGHDVSAFFSALRTGACGISRLPWSLDDGISPWNAPVLDFDATRRLGQKTSSGTDLFTQLALVAVEQAIDSAGDPELDPLRTAVVVGTSMGGVRSLMYSQHVLDTLGSPTMDRKTMIQMWPNMAAAQIAIRWKLHGPSLTICTACASSLDALGNAARLIRAGEVDLAIVGAAEGWLGARVNDGKAFPSAMVYGRSKFGMASQVDDARRASLPFDRNRTGIVGGDGAAFFVIESAPHATARGQQALARIRGYASLADGYHPSSPDPSGEWEALAMRRALDSSDGLDAADIDAIFAHATGTPVGDTSEIRAINQVFGGANKPPATSVKGHIGHSGAAAAGMGIIAAIKGMQSETLVHTLGTTELDPEIEFPVPLGNPQPLAMKTVLVNAFGFGGQNASLVLSAA